MPGWHCHCCGLLTVTWTAALCPVSVLQVTKGGRVETLHALVAVGNASGLGYC
jgi:hypothetical protein